MKNNIEEQIELLKLANQIIEILKIITYNGISNTFINKINIVNIFKNTSFHFNNNAEITNPIPKLVISYEFINNIVNKYNEIIKIKKNNQRYNFNYMVLILITILNDNNIKILTSHLSTNILKNIEEQIDKKIKKLNMLEISKLEAKRSVLIITTPIVIAPFIKSCVDNIIQKHFDNILLSTIIITVIGIIVMWFLYGKIQQKIYNHM
jgi:hypothetical protein